MTVRHLLCAATLLAAPAPAQERLMEDVTWRGQVTLDQDLEVAVGATLRIAAGTVVTVSSSDKSQSGWNSNRVELHVKGRIQVMGTPAEPVRFTVAGGPAEPAVGDADPGAPPDLDAAWHGIVLHGQDVPGRDRDILRHAVFDRAWSAIQVPRDGPQIAGCVFLRCRVGVEVGCAYRSSRDAGAEPGYAQPEIDGCRFARCFTGVFAEKKGTPEVRRCVFYRCRYGVGDVRNGYSYRLEEPGAAVEHAAFIANHIGVIGQASVRNSIFLTNGTAVTLSAFHRTFSSDIDHVSLQANVFWENDRIIDGDTGLDADPVVVDPQLRGPLSDLAKRGPALPACLALGGDSPARGRATGGGDPGPLGTSRADAASEFWRPEGEVAYTLLALPYDEADDDKPIKGTVAPGRRVKDRWWAALPVSSRGVADIDRLPRGDQASWIAVPVRVTKSGPITIEVNADCARIELYWDGERIGFQHQRRRFGISGLVLNRDEKAGKHLLAVKIVGWGTERRFGVSVQGEVRVPGKLEPPAPLQAKSAKIVRERDGVRSIDLELDDEVHWADSGRTDCVELFDQDGKPIEGGGRLPVEVRGPRQVRVLGVPADWPPRLQVALRGLRGAGGQAADQESMVTAR